ncbi:hypothetical protein ACVWVV_003658 [Ewingella americana]
MQRGNFIGHYHVGAAENTHRTQRIEDFLCFVEVDVKHRLRQGFSHGMGNVFKLLGVILPPLLHKVKQLDEDKNTDSDHRNGGYRRHLFNG